MVRWHQLLETRAGFATTTLTTGFAVPAWANAAIFYWNLSAIAGTTPIADLKLQAVDATSGTAIDIDSASFAQLNNTTGFECMVVMPGITTDTTGNFRAVQGLLPSKMNAVWTFDRTSANETYTFTLSVDWMKI